MIVNVALQKQKLTTQLFVISVSKDQEVKATNIALTW